MKSEEEEEEENPARKFFQKERGSAIQSYSPLKSDYERANDYGQVVCIRRPLQQQQQQSRRGALIAALHSLLCSMIAYLSI